MLNLNPCIASINYRPIGNNKPISFGTLSKEYKDCEGVKYRNDTKFFRGDLNWKMAISHIISKGTPQRIYCYGCSDGSEPYSIALYLIKTLGYENAKEYFPIIAKDIDESLISQAQERKIYLDESDIKRIEKFTPDDEPPYFKKVSDILNKEGNKLYLVSDRLADCVEFQQGNLLEDSRKLNYENSTIFFRNAWPYISENNTHKLLNVFSRRFQDSTTLVVGAFDRNKISTDKCDRHYFDDMLLRKGLWQVKPLVYEKCPKLNFKNSGHIIANEVVNNFLNFYEYFRCMLNIEQ